MTDKRPVVAVSGGFDPVHSGHVCYVMEAANYGDVHVYLNTDEWLMRKKGYVFLPFKTRADILWAMKGVKMVLPADDGDETVCKMLQKFRPDFFAKGGDRGPDNTPEAEICGHLGIEMLYGVGGDKIDSSSDIVRKSAEQIRKVQDNYLERWIQEDGG